MERKEKNYFFQTKSFYHLFFKGRIYHLAKKCENEIHTKHWLAGKEG